MDCGLYSPWNSPGQNTGVGSLSLLQGVFPTQGSNPGLPLCRQILYQLSHKENQISREEKFNFFLIIAIILKNPNLCFRLTWFTVTFLTSVLEALLSVWWNCFHVPHWYSLMSYRIQGLPAVASAGILEGISAEESKNLWCWIDMSVMPRCCFEDVLAWVKCPKRNLSF